MPRLDPRTFLLAPLFLLLVGCQHVRLFRPGVLKQLDGDVARLVNYFPAVDDPNEGIVGRLFAHGGLSRAEVGEDGVMRDRIRVPRNELIWKPAVIVMPRSGELELTVANEDDNLHMVYAPSNGDRRLLHLPPEKAGRVRVQLDEPGLYWFGCPVANHAGRGMLGLILVEGKAPPEARLERPKLPSPE